MMVTFHSKAWSSVTLFGDVAAQLLKMMGHSGTVPSAILAADIPAALARLKSAVAATSRPATEHMDKGDKDRKEEPVSLRQRAFPLIDLLTRATAKGAQVMWAREN